MAASPAPLRHTDLHPPVRESGSARVAVLMGGPSSEREVSLKSGSAVLAALRSRGWNAVGIDVDEDLPARLRQEGAEVAWIALHGAIGEDGCVQGLLEVMRIPYTGSPVRASAVAMDKIATKRALTGQGVRLPADAVWRPGAPVPADFSDGGVVKVPNGGSTIGTWVCHDAAAMQAALAEAATQVSAEGGRVLLEQFVAGEEITVAVLDGNALPVVLIRPEGGFFDFEAKYTKGRTEYLVPAPLPAAVVADAQAQAVAACDTLGLAGVARADFIVDEDGTAWFLEVNTSPGFTATSLSPMAAGAAGLSFEDLVDHLACTARLHVHP